MSTNIDKTKTTNEEKPEQSKRKPRAKKEKPTVIEETSSEVHDNNVSEKPKKRGRPRKTTTEQ